MFLKTDKESITRWEQSYVDTPSSDTGPSFTYLRREFGMNLFKNFVLTMNYIDQDFRLELE